MMYEIYLGGGAARTSLRGGSVAPKRLRNTALEHSHEAPSIYKCGRHFQQKNKIDDILWPDPVTEISVKNKIM